MWEAVQGLAAELVFTIVAKRSGDILIAVFSFFSLNLIMEDGR